MFIECQFKNDAVHLYEAELSPADSVADGGERGYSQQEVQAKPQNPHGVVGVGAPGHGGVKRRGPVLPDLDGREGCLLSVYVRMGTDRLCAFLIKWE